ncbi:MAG: hypothetical protein K8F24_05140 [Bacteroidales bacterium]|nr:hypothetical protein [Bacteroidales bacterium]
MSTIELRHIITEHLSQIDDPSFLNAIKTIVESKISSGMYELSEFQIDRINSARNDLKNGQLISHDELQHEINQWLEEK